MAANIGSEGPVGIGEDLLPKPSAVVMAYTGHARYATEEPPTFVVLGAQAAPARRAAGRTNLDQALWPDRGVHRPCCAALCP
jgi:hypothetical protein